MVIFGDSEEEKKTAPEDEDENFESVLPALPTEEKEIACTCQLT